MQIPEEMRDGVVFLYCRIKGKERPAGTGFFVGYPITDNPQNAFHVLLTAHHVIAAIRKYSDDHKVLIRLNTKSAGTCWFETTVDSWRHDGTDAGVEPKIDCAMLPWHPTPDMNVAYSAWHLGVGAGTDEVLEREGLGLGDEVFAVGLFRLHLGRDRNEPIVRVGNIAAIPTEPVKSKRYPEMRAILVEARSIGGLSGSPVFVHMGYWRWREGSVKHATGDLPFFLLGLMHGHWEVDEADIDGLLVEGSGAQTIHAGVGMVVTTEQIMVSISPFLEKARRDDA